MAETAQQKPDEPDRAQNPAQDMGHPNASNTHDAPVRHVDGQPMPAQSPGRFAGRISSGERSQGAEQNPIQHAMSEVEHERRPRRMAVRYGREWLVLYVIAVVAVVALAILVHSAGILPADVGIARELQENRSPIVFLSMLAVSWLGYEPQVTVLFILAIIGLWLLRFRLEAVFLLLSEAGDLIAEVVKIVVARARPSAHLVDVVTHLSSYSFPSGHTVHYTVFYGFLGFVIVTNFRAHWVRQVCLAICIALIVLVGPSRVYLGEHWPTDVLAGYLIGGLFLVPLIAAYLWAKDNVIVITHWPFFVWRHPGHGHHPLTTRHTLKPQRSQSTRRGD